MGVRSLGLYLTFRMVTGVTLAAVASASKTGHMHLIFLKCFCDRLVPCSQGQRENVVETASGQLWYCSFVVQWLIKAHNKSGKYQQFGINRPRRSKCFQAFFSPPRPGNYLEKLPSPLWILNTFAKLGCGWWEYFSPETASNTSWTSPVSCLPKVSCPTTPVTSSGEAGWERWQAMVPDQELAGSLTLGQVWCSCYLVWAAKIFWD